MNQEQDRERLLEIAGQIMVRSLSRPGASRTAKELRGIAERMQDAIWSGVAAERLRTYVNTESIAIKKARKLLDAVAGLGTAAGSISQEAADLRDALQKIDGMKESGGSALAAHKRQSMHGLVNTITLLRKDNGEPALDTTDVVLLMEAVQTWAHARELQA